MCSILPSLLGLDLGGRLCELVVVVGLESVGREAAAIMERGGGDERVLEELVGDEEEG